MNLRTSEAAKRIFAYAKDSVSSTYGPMAQRLSALRRYSSRLDQTSQAYQIVGSVFTADSSIISDDLLDLAPDLPAETTVITQDIESDVYDALSDALKDMANLLNNDDSIQDPEPFVVIDGDGISYKFLHEHFIHEHDDYDDRWVMMRYDDEGEELQPITLMYDHYERSGGHACSINNILTSMDGRYHKTLTAWLQSIAVTATLNDMTNQVAKLCAMGRANVTTIYSTLSSFLSSKISSVKSWANTYISIINESGLSGLVNYMLRNLKAIGTGVTDDAGRMVFTDNSSLIPQEYIGTMLVTLATTVGGLMLAFGGIIVKIIGTALMAAGRIVSWFGKTAWSDYNSETLAGLIDSDNSGEVSVIPESPHACCQFELYTEAFDSVFENVSGICVIDVPGGFLHVGPSGREGYVRCEFHPHAFWTFHDFNCDYWLARPKDGGFNSTGIFAVPNGVSMDASSLVAKWQNGYDVGSTYVMSNLWNGAGLQVFSSEADRVLRHVIVRNIGFFMLWLSGINAIYNISLFHSYLPISDVSASSPPSVAIMLAGSGDPISFINNSLLTPVAFAFLPIESNAAAKYGSDGSSAGNLSIPDPSWTNIATWCSNFHDTTFASSSSIIVTGSIGLNMKANYGISMGTYYPLLGDQSFIEYHPDIFSDQQNFSLKTALAYGAEYSEFLGEIDFVQNTISSGIYTPKYNRETYWMWVGIVVTTTVVVAAVTVIASLKIRKFARRKRALNSAKVEKARADLVAHPDNVAYADKYSKEARKANLWSNVVGGTTFDTSNYWLTGSSQSEPVAGKITSYILGDDNADTHLTLLQTIKNLIKVPEV